ncbi:ORF1123 [White spot syndrome virus]|uniref:ORF1123 n=1 Tax=White spot syndrome virus TaxID=342409 RepID=A0A2D3I6Q6_9VIRU|nr:ORF1123 [White spot syndrome virus]
MSPSNSLLIRLNKNIGTNLLNAWYSSYVLRIALTLTSTFAYLFLRLGVLTFSRLQLLIFSSTSSK